MEMYNEEGKPAEEYLSIALEDLQMRLQPKVLSIGAMLLIVFITLGRGICIS